MSFIFNKQNAELNGEIQHLYPNLKDLADAENEFTYEQVEAMIQGSIGDYISADMLSIIDEEVPQGMSYLNIVVAVLYFVKEFDILDEVINFSVRLVKMGGNYGMVKKIIDQASIRKITDV